MHRIFLKPQYKVYRGASILYFDASFSDVTSFSKMSQPQVRTKQMALNSVFTTLDKSIPLQILYPSSVSWKITPLYFVSSNNKYFVQKEPIPVKMFETSECSGKNLSNLLCQFLHNKSIPLQILYPYPVSWKITSL